MYITISQKYRKIEIRDKNVAYKYRLYLIHNAQILNIGEQPN